MTDTQSTIDYDNTDELDPRIAARLKRDARGWSPRSSSSMTRTRC